MWLLTTIIVLLVIVLFFQPELVSAYWHARYGNSTTFHEWSVPIPKGWRAFTREDQLIIQKMNRFYDQEGPPGIILGIVNTTNAVNPESLKESLRRTLSKDGYVFQHDRTILIDTNRGYCLHFVTAIDKHSIRISCEAPTVHLSLDFFGTDSEMQQFYYIVGQMKRTVADSKPWTTGDTIPRIS